MRRPTPCFPTFVLAKQGGAPKEWQRKRDSPIKAGLCSGWCKTVTITVQLSAWRTWSTLILFGLAFYFFVLILFLLCRYEDDWGISKPLKRSTVEVFWSHRTEEIPVFNLLVFLTTKTWCSGLSSPSPSPWCPSLEHGACKFTRNSLVSRLH